MCVLLLHSALTPCLDISIAMLCQVRHTTARTVMAEVAQQLVPVLASQGLATIFGPEGAAVGKIIQDAFNAPGFTDIKSETSFTYKLAASYGTLNKDSIKQMDEQLKVCIAGTVHELSKVTENNQQPSWDKVVEVMQQNTLVEPCPNEPPVNVHDRYINNSSGAFMVDGKPSQDRINEILMWFQNVVKDDDVLKATAINHAEVEKLARIVGETGVSVSDIGSIFHGEENVQRTLLDVGVLRFPDLDHPYFKVYRLKLHAWRSSTRDLFVEKNSNGLDVEFNCRKYKPRESVLAAIRREVIDRAAREAEALFG